MSPEQLDRLCGEAMQRLRYFINRAAGQHVRAILGDSKTGEST